MMLSHGLMKFAWCVVGGLQKWSKGKQKEKVKNGALFDQDTSNS
jgi:hypothetical protein